MKKLDLKYKWKFFLAVELFALGAIAFVFIFLYFTVFLENNPPTWLLVALVVTVFVVTAFSWLWASLVYYFFKYEIRSDSFRKESGIIWKKYTTIPYSRIQNIDIERGLLDRILGLSSVIIHTAGSSNPYVREGEVPGLSVQTAEQLREELVRRLKSVKDDQRGL